MKLRNKVFTLFAVFVLALSMMVGTAMAATTLPAIYDEAAGGMVLDGQTSGNDVWIKIIGSGELYGDSKIANATRSVDITVSGKCTFDAELIYNSDGGWAVQPVQTGLSVDGDLVLTMPMDGTGTSWCEAVVNLKNKTEGPLSVSKMEFKDEAGTVLLTVGGADGVAPNVITDTATDESSTAAATPKTGVVSLAFVYGIFTATCGIGAKALKRINL
jgi:hypothetical protein